MSELAVKASGLGHRYAKQTALEGIEFSIEAGTRCALIGPDGPGEMRLTRMSGAELRKDGSLLLDAIKAVGFFPGPRVAFVEEATDGLADSIAGLRPGRDPEPVFAGRDDGFIGLSLQPVRGGALSFIPRSIYCTGLVFNFSSWKPLHVAMLKNLLGGSLKKVALLSLQAEMAP